VLNPDLVFQEGVFTRLIGRLERGEGDLAAPVLVDSQGSIQDSFRRLPSPWELVYRRVGGGAPSPEPGPGAILRPEWIAGMFMFMRRATFASLGGFDARYRLYFEDVDFCTRARLMGLSILVDAGLRLRHDPRRASRRAGKYLLWHVQSALRFFTSDVHRRARAMNPHA
jgi:GT2 family glycosyltransferase